MIKFDSSIGVYASSVDEVREQVSNIFINALAKNGGAKLNTDPATPQGQLIDSITACIVQKDNELLHLFNMFNPQKAEGIWQDALGAVYFLERHQAVASRAKVTCFGHYDVMIPTGAQILSSYDSSKWQCIKGDSIKDDGQVVLEFECTQPGPKEAPAHSLNKIITTIAGWDSADNEQAAIVGQDVEGTASYEHRRYNSVALNARSSMQSTYSRIAALDGVIALCVRQNRTDEPLNIDGVTIKPHSIYCCVLGGHDGDIASALYATVSAGCDYTGGVKIDYKDPHTKARDIIRFSRPKERAISITVEARKSDLNPLNADTIIKDCIYSNFYGTKEAQIYSLTPVNRVVMGDDLFSSRFYSPLMSMGIKSVMSIKLNWHGVEQQRESMAIPIDTCPTLSRDDIKIIWRSSVIPEQDDSFGFKGDNQDNKGFNMAPFYHGQYDKTLDDVMTED